MFGGVQVSRYSGLGVWAGARSFETGAGALPAQALPPVAGPGYSGSRCFMGISFGLALVEGLLAAAGARLVPDCLMRAPSVERGGGGNGWADGLTAGALRTGLEPPTKNIRRAAPGAGLGRFHCHGREPNEAVIEPNPNKLSASSAPGRPRKGNGANLHNSFTWGEAAALLRVSRRTVAHAARVLSEDSPAAPAVRLAVEQGRVTVSDASRVIDEPTEVQLRALERVTGGGSRNLAGAAQGLPPGGGLRWWARLSAVLGRPHGGSGERRHDGSHQPARTWGRCGGGGVRSGRRRWSPWGLAGAFSGLDIASALLRLRGGKRGTGRTAPGPP